MDSLVDTLPRLQRFLRESAFATQGAVMTDLDGTAVHEHEGRVLLSRTMELGLGRVHAAGREVIANTLRFPLSVMRVFGAEWKRASGADLYLVSLKGSQIGRVTTASCGSLTFEEIDAFPLLTDEVNEVLDGVRGMVEQGVRDLLVFFYPRDWRCGEHIWVADSARVETVQRKYCSASHVFAGGLAALEEAVLSQPQCMVFLLIDAPQDRLMAYQHTDRQRFVTHAGVDKRFGAEALASVLGVRLEHSIGAGDAETDTFLGAVGFAAIVGNQNLDFRGLRETVRLADPAAFGELLLAAADTLV